MGRKPYGSLNEQEKEKVRAYQRQYLKKRIANNPQYKQRVYQSIRRYQQANKEKVNRYQRIKLRKQKLTTFLDNLVNQITLKLQNPTHQIEYYQTPPEVLHGKELITITLRNGKTKTLTRKQNERRERTKKYLREYMKRRYHTEGDPWKERIKKQIIEWQARNQDKKRAYVRKYFTIEEHRQHRREWHKARRAKIKQLKEQMLNQKLNQNANPLQVKQVIKEMTNEGYDWDNNE